MSGLGEKLIGGCGAGAAGCGAIVWGGVEYRGHERVGAGAGVSCSAVGGGGAGGDGGGGVGLSGGEDAVLVETGGVVPAGGATVLDGP
jgi:hypothetical protein